jgi:hypothetical protein
MSCDGVAGACHVMVWQATAADTLSQSTSVSKQPQQLAPEHPVSEVLTHRLQDVGGIVAHGAGLLAPGAVAGRLLVASGACAVGLLQAGGGRGRQA